MSGTIADPQTIAGEIVLSERVTTNEFIIVEIQENIRERYVRAEIELGPFVTEQRPMGDIVRGSSRRGIVVWQNEAYDTVRDTWRNEDLMLAVTAMLNQ